MNKTLNIGTRGSPLALVQAESVRAALKAVVPDITTEIVKILTSGDWKPSDGEVRLSVKEGGKGQFAKEIEQALLAGEVDCAVHSMKDMETRLPDGLTIPVMLPREDARDCLLLSDELRAGYVPNEDDPFEVLPKGATLGTASVRRQAFLQAKRPDLNFVPLRGNVGTRIEKVRSGQVDATFLALAGLNRLGLSHEVDVILPVEVLLPAAGQGAVGIEILENKNNILAIIGQLNCTHTLCCVSAERAALEVLDGSCHTPIGAYALQAGGQMHVRLAVAALDGSAVFTEEDRAAVDTVEAAQDFGAALARRLKTRLPEGILAQEVSE